MSSKSEEYRSTTDVSSSMATQEDSPHFVNNYLNPQPPPPLRSSRYKSANYKRPQLMKIKPAITKQKRSTSFKFRNPTKPKDDTNHNNIPISTQQLQNQPQTVITNHDYHPIIQVLREEQLGRNIFLLAIPIATGFMAYYNPVSLTLPGRLAAVALSLGSVAIWNGILLRRAWPRASNASEVVGVSLLLLSFFGYLASRLPVSYIWLPLLCMVASLAPLGVALCAYNFHENGGHDNQHLIPAPLSLV